MPRSPYFEYLKNSEYRYLPNLIPNMPTSGLNAWNPIVRVWFDKQGMIYKAEGLVDKSLKWEATTFSMTRRSSR